jgi:hypothetical protein
VIPRSLRLEAGSKSPKSSHPVHIIDQPRIRGMPKRKIAGGAAPTPAPAVCPEIDCLVSYKTKYPGNTCSCSIFISIRRLCIRTISKFCQTRSTRFDRLFFWCLIFIFRSCPSRSCSSSSSCRCEPIRRVYFRQAIDHTRCARNQHDLDAIFQLWFQCRRSFIGCSIFRSKYAGGYCPRI